MHRARRNGKVKAAIPLSATLRADLLVGFLHGGLNLSQRLKVNFLPRAIIMLMINEVRATRLDRFEDLDLDFRLLDSVLDDQDVHNTAEKIATAQWNYTEILTDEIFDAVMALGPDRFKDLPRKLERALVLFTVTEDGVAMFTPDTHRIFNPLGNNSDESNPHGTYERRWASMEYQHHEFGTVAMRGLGYSTEELMNLRLNFHDGGDTPKPLNSADGLVFVNRQENGTKRPYSWVIEEAEKYLKILEQPEVGREVEGNYIRALIECYKKIRSDEALHEKYAFDVIKGGLITGGKEIASHMVRGLHTNIVEEPFLHAGRGIDNFDTRAARVAVYGAFSLEDVDQCVESLLRRLGIVDFDDSLLLERERPLLENLALVAQQGLAITR